MPASFVTHVYLLVRLSIHRGALQESPLSSIKPISNTDLKVSRHDFGVVLSAVVPKRRGEQKHVEFKRPNQPCTMHVFGSLIDLKSWIHSCWSVLWVTFVLTRSGEKFERPQTSQANFV